MPQISNSKVPKVTILVTFGFSSLLPIATFGGSILWGGRNFRVDETCTVQGPYEVTVIISRQMWKHPSFYLEKSIPCYCLLNRNSKELFDYSVVIFTDERKTFKRKKCNVPLELHKGMSKIIITVKNKSRMSLVKLVVSIISFISSKKENYFSSSLLSGCRYFRGSLILVFANICYRYFRNFT